MIMVIVWANSGFHALMDGIRFSFQRMDDKVNNSLGLCFSSFGVETLRVV
jgi:hypothetical protein